MNDERPRWLSSAVALAASLVVLGAWLAVLDRHPASAGWAGSWAMVGLAGALGLAVVGVLATRRIGALERAARDAPLRAYDDVSDLGGGGEIRVATQLPLVSPRDADREVVLDGSGRVVSVEGVGDIVRVVAPSSVDAQAVARAVAKVRRPGDRFVLGGPP